MGIMLESDYVTLGKKRKHNSPSKSKPTDLMAPVSWPENNPNKNSSKTAPSLKRKKR